MQFRVKQVVVFILLVLILVPGVHAARFSSSLEERLQTSVADEMIPVIIQFSNSVPGEQLLKEVEFMNHVEQREYVIHRLRTHMYSEAGNVIHWLEQQVNEGTASDAKELWIAHAYVIELAAFRFEELRDFSSVSYVHLDDRIPSDEVLDEDRSAVQPDDGGSAPVDRIAWGIDHVGARDLWDMGIYGNSILVAIIDTGVDLNHPAFTGHIWENPGEIPGNGVDDDENGFTDDIHGWNFAEDNPSVYDVYGHGTSCAGITVGQPFSSDTTGFAPGATLMVLRNWGETYLSESSFPLAVQYAVANGARVITSSMSYPVDYDEPVGYITQRQTQENSLAAGIIQNNSGGNNGHRLAQRPVPWNINCPANCPPPWLHPEQTLVGGVSAILCVGAIDDDNNIEYYSPYGPSEWFDEEYPELYRDYPYVDGEFLGLIRPDVVAPGSLRTARNGGGTRVFEGTSAASPAVGGCLTLLRDAFQQATPAQLTEAVYMSAVDLGDEGFDNRFGAGLIMVNGAFDYLDEMIETGAVEVEVLDNEGEHVPQARISVGDDEVLGWTGDDGIAIVPRIIPGIYSVAARADEYGESSIDNIEVLLDDTTEVIIVLSELGFNIDPLFVSETLPVNDTLNVTFSLTSNLEETTDLSVNLEPRGGLDWTPDSEIDFRAIMGLMEVRGIAWMDSLFVLAGSYPSGDPQFWRFYEDGTLIDSFPQPPQAGSSGVGDMATDDSSHLLVATQGIIYTLDTTFTIIDSIETTLTSIGGLAYDDETGEFYISNRGTTILHLDSEGNVLGELEASHTVVGLAYYPDDRWSECLYSIQLSGNGLADLVRIDLASGVNSFMGDLAPDGLDMGVGLDTYISETNPFRQVVSLQVSQQLKVFSRDLLHESYYLDAVESLPPEGLEVLFDVYGPWFTEHTSVELDLIWSNLEFDWRFPLPVTLDIIPEVGVNDSYAVLPTTTRLERPWPNPFNPTVRLAFSLESISDVRLSIYNLLGREVDVLLDSRLEAGTGIITWNAEAYPSGTYFAILQTDHGRFAQKLLLLK